MVLNRYNPLLHYTAVGTTAATMLLILMGGLVTSHGAGMSVPDWPNSYGYNMWLFPPSLWWDKGGIFYEHSHRLLATGVGMLAIVMTLLAFPAPAERKTRSALTWGGLAGVIAGIVILLTLPPRTERTGWHVAASYAALIGVAGSIYAVCFAWLPRKHEPRRWVRRLMVGVLAFVIFQGVLGGLRVVLIELHLAIVHGIVAQLFFCTAALAAMVTSRWWNKAPNMAWSEDYESGRRLTRVAWIAFAVVFAQLIIGALMRHNAAGLAIPDLPWAYGKVIPPLTAAELDTANQHRAFRLHMDPVSLAQIWLHMGHRIGAILASAVIVWLVAKIFRQHSGQPVLTRPAILLLVLLAVQITLGVYTVILQKPADVASAHVGVGATVLVFCFMLAVRSMRLYSRRFRVRSEPVRVEVRSIGPKGFLVS